MSAGFVSTRQSHLAFEIVAGIDINVDALATYHQNIGSPALKMNVREIAAEPKLLIEALPSFDPVKMRPLVFIGCPPCQGFSALRKGDNRDDVRNDLSLAFAKIVAFFKPDVVVMENVPEILRGRFAAHFSAAKALMHSAGYSFAEGVLDLSLFGVPQRRKRALVLGALDRAPQLPIPILAPSEAKTVREAISHLRPLNAGEVDPHDAAHRAPAHTERLIELFEKIPADGGDRRALPDALKLKAHRRLDSGVTPGFTDVYGRLRWDTPSVTITAKSRSPSSGRFLHPEQHRNITVREAALLQGFPHAFSFSGPPTQQYRQIGEAVPPIFARSVAWAILEHLLPNTPSLPAISRKLQANADVSNVVTVDCFSGAGGLSLGFSVAGFDPVFAFDADHAATKTYSNNFPINAEHMGIESPFLVEKINAAVNGRDYCLIGGPPCQGFSHQRRGDAYDPRNELVLKYAQLVTQTEVKPSAIVLENVTDLDLPRGKDILRSYTSFLTEAGYRCFRYDLNSADFGVPQLRKRIFVVAISDKLAPHFHPPKPLTPKRWLTVGEALSTLPAPSQLPGVEVANHIPSREGEENRRRIAHVDMGLGRKSIPRELQLACHANSYRGHRDVFGRLDWFSQARTITAGFDSFTRGEYGHPFRHRSITPREAARLQGFPDWFDFIGNKAEVRRQIGNAVPPPLGFAVAKSLLSAFHQAEASRWAA